MPTKKKENWRTSKAKRILGKDIVSGKVRADMKADEVYQMHSEYKKWPKKNFAPNLKRLRKSIAEDYDRSRSDSIAYGHDLARLMTLRAGDPPAKKPWHKSNAKRLLKQDVEDGKHELMKPAELYSTRVEYQEFDLETFRNHIYQERDGPEKLERRFARKKKSSYVDTSSLSSSSSVTSCAASSAL